MQAVFIFVHIAACLALIFIVLLQKGKGAGMGAAFGGSSQTVFGSSGATSLLHKVTTFVAIIFMVTSLGLTLFFGQGKTTSVMEGVEQTGTPPAAQTSEAPSAPAAEGQSK